RMPPLAFTSFFQSSYPALKAAPSAAKSPPKESDAPMVIGAVELVEPDELAEPVLLLVLPLLLVLLLLLHAARTPTESATAPTTTAFLENQGRCALTP